MASGTDSAGVPWEGRAFEANSWGHDDGSAPEQLVEAIRRFHARELGEADVVDAVRGARLLIPLVAHLGESGRDEHGRLVDKSQELSIVTVSAPDGRAAMPAFTSVQAMSAWNPQARPVPTDAVKVAIAAAHEQTDLIILDPTSATEFAIRRPAVWAIAAGADWQPGYRDPAVIEAFAESAAPHTSIDELEIVPGDPASRLDGPEVLVRLALVPGLSSGELDSLLRDLQEAWAADERIAGRVDSLGVSLGSTGGHDG